MESTYRNQLTAKPWWSLALVQLLFLAAIGPYLTGQYVFAPAAYVAERGFRSDDRLGREIVPRDRFGAEDYLDQERIYLRFYRESVRNGELPFWNKRTFGGVSQEDSMIFSYASPLNLVWAFISNDHVAKGVQIFLLLNLGAIAVFWWCRILGVGPVWTTVAIILATLTPLALHFQAHTHQPALYYSGLLLLAAFQRLMDIGGIRQLWSFFLLSCLAVAFNFLSLLLFACIAMAVLGVTNFIRPSMQRGLVAGRIAIAAAAFLFALGTMSFFIGPIVLESHLVREPVVPVLRSFAPWASWPAALDSLSHFRFGDGVWIPLIAALPVFLAYRWYRKTDKPAPVAVIGLVGFLVLAAVVSGVGPFIKLFSLHIPGMQYSTNASFRLLFFANLCAIPALMWFFQNSAKSDHRPNRGVTFILVGILVVNATLYLAGAGINSIDAMPEKARLISSIMVNQGLVEPAGFASLISIMFLILWLSKPAPESLAGMFLVLLIGAGYVGMYHFQRPNLPVALDPASHPIFASVERNSTVLTLESCDSKDRSWYRSEAALAGFRSLDGPTDVGLFPQVRNFWAHWNDVAEFNKRGANLMEVLWVCSDRVLDKAGRVEPVFAALVRVLGVRYVFTDRNISDSSMREVDSTGRLRAYENKSVWNEISFIPGYSASALESLLVSLSKGDAMALSELERIERRRIGISGSESGNLAWDLEIPTSVRDRDGVLFMSHPNEYHRGVTLPFMDLPLEGRWVLQDGRSEREFPMRAIPFRLIDMATKSSHVQIRYSLVHYYFWLPISLAAFAGFLGFQGIYLRKTAGRTAEGPAEA